MGNVVPVEEGFSDDLSGGLGCTSEPELWFTVDDDCSKGLKTPGKFSSNQSFHLLDNLVISGKIGTIMNVVD